MRAGIVSWTSGEESGVAVLGIAELDVNFGSA